MINALPVQLHVLAVVLFLILFIVKAFMLFTNKTQALENFRRKTRFADIFFGVLILLTGGYLMLHYPNLPGWLLTKVLLVLAAIPAGIIGFKKRQKPLVALALLIFVYVYHVAENKSLAFGKAAPEQTTEITDNKPFTENITKENGMVPEEKTAPAISDVMSQTATSNAKQIYLQQCEVCHTRKDKKGKNLGSDLAYSKLNLAERTAVILNGRGEMPAYKGQISEQEAEELASFTQQFIK